MPVACTDTYGEWPPAPEKEGNLILALDLPLPKTVELATRAFTEEQEREIEEITLLLFVEDQSNTERLESTLSIPGTALNRNPTNNRLYTTTATLKAGTYSTFIVLANSAGALAAQSALLTKGTARTQIEEGLLLSLDDGERWNATPPNPRRFPMWGIIEGGTTGIVITGTAPSYTVSMFRMISSIDLIIEQQDEQGQPLPAIDLTQLYLCNFYRNGRMIPVSTPANYDGSKLLDASLPPTANRLAHTDPLAYDGTLADPTARVPSYASGSV
ncbi:MAG: FimB/Mfa2 family fimbrial subunit, partial [Clostridium sp.]|nr:FimB/Mfa2 family fimbrial subunit [Clostridium sp.]